MEEVVVTDLKWKQVLNSNNTQTKPPIHVKFEVNMHVRAFVPHVRTWTIVNFLAFCSSSMMSVQWLSSLSLGYLLVKKFFNERKKETTCIDEA